MMERNKEELMNKLILEEQKQIETEDLCSYQEKKRKEAEIKNDELELQLQTTKDKLDYLQNDQNQLQLMLSNIEAQRNEVIFTYITKQLIINRQKIRE